ncbi:interleukin-21 receptor-like isoform X1 [Toxotes jaculatrix]|uniref:interleukin-21 receptor-like isoform X1 n=1 Tax=Toxotes jaculatrix TaxID=941984 RepID=UPI001B3A9239|nr:interleukin-21 receptor-like isoform X1 [Toxotes jaculatrix]XP_040900432.1 interleukin-21 receptor-like isoform X1 [Toxotes jaculatrix]
MKCPQLLFVCWCSSILTVTSCFRADGYSCVSAYWNTITCVLNITGNPVGQSIATYSLKFIENWKKQNYACPLVSMNHSYSSVCEVTERKTFNHRQKYSIYLCNESVCHPLLEEFIPSRNIQLTPPDDVKVQPTPEAFNITWKSGYEEHMFFQSRLDYKLLLQKSQSSWSKNLSETQKFVSIRRDELDAYATYCIRVKSKPSSHLYKGAWSEWSPLTCWNNDVQQGEQDNKLVILIKSLAPVCVVAGVLLFVFYSPAVRMKIKTLSYTPSPAPFFQPLFEQNKGNLKEWFSHQSKFAQTSKTEEILITSPVTVVPKPIKKDQEENQDFNNSSVAQLDFSQCQTSYVGLPGMHEEARHPMTVVCPGDTSYTQLPSSVWGFGVEQVQALSFPPEDFLEISNADSGCSCEDLTQSPDCSLLHSAIVDSLPTCYCSDYCVLNKTVEGVVPVLVSK